MDSLGPLMLGLVVIALEDPLLPLARLRARGELGELRAECTHRWGSVAEAL